MVSGISSNVNSLQLLRAANAFKSVNSAQNTSVNNFNPSDIEDQVSIQSSDKEFKASSINNKSAIQLMDKMQVDEIKNVASQFADVNVSDDDINYGLTYGRSVLVDYSA